MAELLQLAEEKAPELYHSWRVVSLRRLPLIEVRSEEVAVATVGNKDFAESLERLQTIVAFMRNADYNHLDVVDLSYDNVPVQPGRP